MKVQELICRKVLLLTDANTTHRETVEEAFSLLGDVVHTHSGPISVQVLRDLQIDFLVSDRYSHIVPKDVINYLQGRAINSHPSLLPSHRGWQPIFFSVRTGSKVGISIHQIDEGIDTGANLIQAEVVTTDHDTLRTLHFRCRQEIVKAFAELWPKIRALDTLPVMERIGGSGNYNSKADFTALFSALPQGWDTLVSEVRRMGSIGLDETDNALPSH